MLLRAFVDEALGNSSYLVASETTGRAIVIDPERDVDRCVRAAEGLGLVITHAVETHLHADFVSGLRELADRHKAIIAASAEAQLAFEHLPLCDGDSISLGDLSLAVLATPGHTPEHISFLLTETGQPAPEAVFTGGALIVGGAARTDLMGPRLTDPLTRLLYHTLRDKLLCLPDDTIVYPTHGAGSFCNAPTSPNRTTTIGRERLGNPLVRAESEEEFVAQALDGVPSYPTYFRYLRAVNQLGPNVLGGIPIPVALTPNAVREQMAMGAAVVDVRTPREFAASHISNAYGIPIAAPLCTWAGWIVPFATPIVLVAEDAATRAEAIRQLIRVGYDDVRGYLEGGMAAWEAEGLPVLGVPLMTVAELQQARAQGHAPRVLDVRQDAEWSAGHLAGAVHIEGGRLRLETPRLPRDERFVVHCGHADRSTIAISLLQQRGFQEISLLYGGYSAWEAAGYPVEHSRE